MARGNPATRGIIDYTVSVGEVDLIAHVTWNGEADREGDRVAYSPFEEAEAGISLDGVPRAPGPSASSAGWRGGGGRRGRLSRPTRGLGE